MMFSTQSLSILSQNIRHTLFAQLRASVSPPKPSISAIAEQNKNEEDAELLYRVYQADENYLEFPDIAKEIEDDPSSANKYRYLSIKMKIFAAYILDKPPVRPHTVLLKTVNDILSDARTSYSDNQPTKEIIDKLCKAVTNYSQSIADYFSEHNAKWQMDPTTDIEHLTYNANMPGPDDVIPPGKHHAYLTQLQKLRIQLAHLKLKDEIVKYILNPTIGTYGLSFMPNLAFPLLMPILPRRMAHSAQQSIWSHRYPEDHVFESPQFKPADIDDHVQRIYEGRFFESMKSNALHEHNKHLNSDGFSKDNGTQDPSSSKTNESDDQKGESSNSDQGNDPGKTHPPPTPTIPDDNAYTPDPLLASRARALTAKAQSLDPTDLRHDHMTRFNRTDESKISLTKREVKTGVDADWTIQTRQQSGTARYVVTFTRKSKKPIFNRID